MDTSSLKEVPKMGRVGRWVDRDGVDHKDPAFFSIALATSPEQEARDLERPLLNTKKDT
jgi:hypothetical protein